jgi:LysM repeat protein
MLAVALNGDNRLTIVGRDVAGGNMTRILASLDIDVGGKGAGMVTCAVWDEDDENQASRGNSSVATSASSAKSSKTLVLPTSTNKPAVSTGGGLFTASTTPAGGSSPVTGTDPLSGVIESLTSALLPTPTDTPTPTHIPTPTDPTGVTGAASTGVGPSTAPPTALVSTTSGSAASAAGAVTTPTPFQAGMIGNCTKFHLVVSGDTCSSIATAAGVSLSDFYTWNPAVGPSCATLFAENNVCIGVGSSH